MSRARHDQAKWVSRRAAAQSVSGTATKVDEAQGKATINHGPIRNLDMDAMTMVFRAGDPEMLKGLNAGGKSNSTPSRSMARSR